MPTYNATKMATATPMCSPLRAGSTSQGDRGPGRKGPFVEPSARSESNDWAY
jgi:hypothetical protein